MISSIDELKKSDDPIILQAVATVEQAKEAVNKGEITEDQYKELINDALEVSDVVNAMSDVKRKTKIKDAIAFLSQFSVISSII